MNKYTKEQSTIVALWVLAKRRENDLWPAAPEGTAPELITHIVNQMGPYHSSDSILLHTHGYDRLLLGRDIDKSVTSLQKEVAEELKLAGVR
ncbi:hypothetical protein [Vibrio ostreicida]|uniref:hypothetical protein n=1 Tax=Vibrio ostreicida TaxID=526588 RepID=UPI0009706F0C|nr:hypothetical protein [Vibrio ostreicida]